MHALTEFRKVAMPCWLCLASLHFATATVGKASAADTPEDNRPNVVLVMADDQGWGETGYYDHPVLKTPGLDELAGNGLRFDRFYAAAPVCSPTRASVLTGRTNNRTGVQSHGYPLRRQEKTLAQALLNAGYETGHFGKWHLNGLRGPGVPVLQTDSHRPDVFGFRTWLSVTNFFDRDPILSRQGKFEEFSGDSSEIVVDQALQFIERYANSRTPSFTVIWFGSPHNPFRATEADMSDFAHLDMQSRLHYGELVAMDRSIATLRRRLRELKVSDNTILWYCSDNGGLNKIAPTTVGPLRGFKGSLYEGGLRVPAIVEWPSQIPAAQISSFPASTMDIFPTLVDVLELPHDVLLRPCDGISLTPLFTGQQPKRERPIPFNCFGESALIDGDFKLLELGRKQKQYYELYDVKADISEQHDLFSERQELASKMLSQLASFKSSLAHSIAGSDYPEGRVLSGEPEPSFWTESEAYRPYFDQWRTRPEYQSRLTPKK